LDFIKPNGAMVAFLFIKKFYPIKNANLKSMTSNLSLF